MSTLESLFDQAKSRLRAYDEICAHYNVAASHAYAQRASLGEPFGADFLPSLIGALIVFDMARQMGKDRARKYRKSAAGFASSLSEALDKIKDRITPYVWLTVSDIHTLPENEQKKFYGELKYAYDQLADPKNSSLDANGKRFDVGATKILHFLNPNLFPIIDRYAAHTLVNTSEGHVRISRKGSTFLFNAETYVTIVEYLYREISTYGINRFRAYSPSIPDMRLVDKILFDPGSSTDQDD